MASARPVVVTRYQNASLAGQHDFAAAGNVGGDHRPAAGRRLEQAFRQALAPRWQDRDMGACPERRNVVDMAEPSDARLVARTCGLRLLDRAGLAGSGVPAIKSSTSSRAAAAAEARGSARECPCRRGACRQRRRLGPGGSGRVVALRCRRRSPGSARCVRGDAEREHAIAVVGILHQHELLWTVQQQAEQRADDRAQQQRLRVARRERVAQARERVDAADVTPQRGKRSKDRGLQCDVMGDGRCDRAVNLTQRTDGRDGSEREILPRTKGTGCRMKPSARLPPRHPRAASQHELRSRHPAPRAPSAGGATRNTSPR